MGYFGYKDIFLWFGKETLHGFGPGGWATSVVVKNASLLTSAMQEVHHVLKPPARAVCYKSFEIKLKNTKCK